VVVWAGPADTFDSRHSTVGNSGATSRIAPHGGAVLSAEPGLGGSRKTESRNQSWHSVGRPRSAMALSAWNLLYGYLRSPRGSGQHDLLDAIALEPRLSAAHGRGANLAVSVQHRFAFWRVRRRHDGRQRIPQTRQSGSFGAETRHALQNTGNRRYLDAATKIAATLARKVASQKFRLNIRGRFACTRRRARYHRDAASSRTHQRTPTAASVSALMKFNQGDARPIVEIANGDFRWMQFPTRSTPKQMWTVLRRRGKRRCGDSRSTADTLADYILDHPDVVAQWRSQSKSIFDWELQKVGQFEIRKGCVGGCRKHCDFRTDRVYRSKAIATQSAHDEPDAV